MHRRIFVVRLVGVALVVVTTVAWGATTIDVKNSGDDVRVTGDYTLSGDIVFANSQATYSTEIRNRGIHFVNGKSNVMSNKVGILNEAASPIIGADAANTVVKYTGTFTADIGNTKPSISVSGGGTFMIGAGATIDLINTSYFTRQFWVHGDGQSTFEIEDGFVADLTKNGTTPVGLGSVRLSNTIFVTHNTLGLPAAIRPDGADKTKINAHLVFENADGSRWRVLTNNQNYPGGLWIGKNITIETVKDLTCSGVTTVWSDYTNYGGVQTTAENITVTKQGAGTWRLVGEQAYNPGAIFDIKAGTIDFHSDPMAGTIKTGTNGQNLTVKVAGGAVAAFSFKPVRLKSLQVASGGTVIVGTDAKVQTATASLNGTLEVRIVGTSPAAGTELALFTWGSVSGTFSTVVSDPPGVTLDISKLYSQGIIRVAGGQVSAIMPLRAEYELGGTGIVPLITGLPSSRGAARQSHEPGAVYDAFGRKGRGSARAYQLLIRP